MNELYRDGVLLYLHGLTAFGIDSRDAHALASALPELRVASPNLPGHGGAPPASDWSPRAIANELARAHPEARCVVGHSWGAAIALWLASDRAERTRGLVLLDGGWFDRADLPRRAPPRDPHHVAALEALFATRSSDAWPRLFERKIPVLAIAGLLGDDGTKRALLDRFERAVPHAEIALLHDVGHDLLRDAPDETSARVAAFIRAR